MPSNQKPADSTEAQRSGTTALTPGSVIFTPFGQTNPGIPGIVPKEIAFRMFLGVTCIQAGFTVVLLICRLIGWQ
jgi:hypothetical protein